MRVLSSGPRWVVGALLLGLLVWCAFCVPPRPMSLRAETLDDIPDFDLAELPAPSTGRALVVEHCRIRLRDDVALAAERTGILAAVHPRGRTVEAGAVVARMRDAAPRKAFAVAEREAANDVEVRFARKRAEVAEVTYVRANRANRDSPGTVPELEIRRLRLDAEQALLQIEQAEHHLAISRLRRDEQAELLKTYTVTAPISGIVTNVLAQPGEVVREGEPILEVVNTNVLEVRGHLRLEQLPAAPVGTQIVVSVELPGPGGETIRRDLPGRITTVDVRVEPLTRKVSFTADVVNVDGDLRDGLAATVAVPIPSGE